MNSRMNKYKCSKCGKESAIMSNEASLSFKCCDGDKNVEQKKVGGAPKAQVVQAPKVMSLAPPSHTPAPSNGPSLLDSKSGGVKGQPANIPAPSGSKTASNAVAPAKSPAITGDVKVESKPLTPAPVPSVPAPTPATK